MTYEVLEVALVLYLNARFPTLCSGLKGPMLHGPFDFGVFKLATNKSFGIEDGIFGVRVKGFFAVSPINHSSLVKETHDGVILCPWSLAMILTQCPRCTLQREVNTCPRAFGAAREDHSVTETLETTSRILRTSLSTGLTGLSS